MISNLFEIWFPHLIYRSPSWGLGQSTTAGALGLYHCWSKNLAESLLQCWQPKGKGDLQSLWICASKGNFLVPFQSFFQISVLIPSLQFSVEIKSPPAVLKNDDKVFSFEEKSFSICDDDIACCSIINTSRRSGWFVQNTLMEGPWKDLSSPTSGSFWRYSFFF